MSELAVDQHLFQILGLLDIPAATLRDACDPASEVLLAWPVYRSIAIACTGGEHGAARIMPLYVAAKAAGDLLAHTTGTRAGVTPAGPGTPVALADQPTVPLLKLPPALVESFAGPPPMLQQIASKRDFGRYLKSLVEQSGLTLREIESNTRKLDPKAVCCRSTLSDALRHGRIPTSEPVMTTLLTVLFAFITRSRPGSDKVVGSTRDALGVWRQLLRPPSGAAVLVAGDGSVPLLREALTKLAQAERTATRIGSPDAVGLAHAQRILRELLT